MVSGSGTLAMRVMAAKRVCKYETTSIPRILERAIAIETKVLRSGDTRGLSDLVKLVKMHREYAPKKPVEVVWLDPPDWGKDEDADD